jgi:hypothetical protein
LSGTRPDMLTSHTFWLVRVQSNLRPLRDSTRHFYCKTMLTTRLLTELSERLLRNVRMDTEIVAGHY